jgi:uncharacterized protein DUF4149
VTGASLHARVVSEALLLAVWIGIAVFFSVVVAPAAFAALPSRALAGAIVGRVLPVIFLTGLLVGGLVAGMELSAVVRDWWRAGPALLLTVSCAIAQFAVGGRIQRLRTAIGPSLDALAADDARRVAFGRLHALSVVWLAVGVAAAAVALVASLLVLRGRS